MTGDSEVEAAERIGRERYIGSQFIADARKVAKAYLALHARCQDAKAATVSEGEEQGFGAPATKERPSSPSLERVAVLEEALRGALDFYETEGQGESDPEWVTVARGLLGGNDG